MYYHYIVGKGMQKPEKKPKFYKCELCDYFTYNKTDYTKHLATLKHRKREDDSIKAFKSSQNTQKKYDCICGKTYNGLIRYYIAR